MKDMGIVEGSAAQAQELIVGKTTVYVHTDIVEVGDGLYQYHEIQYDKDEYIKLMSEKNKSLENQLTDTQLALCEVYELML